MKVISRRQFMGTAGVAGWAASRGVSRLFAAGSLRQSGPTYPQLEPTRAINFTRPLRLPSTDGGMFGIFQPPDSFEITARMSMAELVPGAVTPLWNFEVESAGKRFMNPIIRIPRNGRIRAKLKNELLEHSIIHWHGLNVDWRNDGHPMYEIGPGGTYDYDFPILNRAGTYWYHPHAHGNSGMQVNLGLASFFIVEDDEEIQLRNALDLTLGQTDIPLILQDRRFNEGAFSYDPNEEDLLSGFLGDVILVNGTVNPFLDVQSRIYRFRILNGSNSRNYRLALTNGSNPVPFTIIGNDGGLLDRPYPASQVFLAPAERVDVLIDLRSARDGDVYFLESRDFDPMHREHDHGVPTRTRVSFLPDGFQFFVLKLNVKGTTAYDKSIPQRLSEIIPISGMSDSAGKVFSFEAPDLHDDYRTWKIRVCDPTPEGTFCVEHSFEMDSFPVVVQKGTPQLWQMVNENFSMPHPMHLHGFQFQVLQRSGTPAQAAVSVIDGQGRLATDKGWKDTVNLWPGESVRVGVDFSHPFTGEQNYLYHCHILEHQDKGMMINYKVV
ncbi:MAG: multicopper oxidase family protein [Acidobacteria bacterium]|nr:multicopper oxidase family protein [Acidobacteriota bacterium]